MRTKQEIMQLIEEEDVEFVRLQFTDVFGNLKNIAVTLGQMEKVVEGKFSIDGSALFDDLYNPECNLFLMPDLDSFVILPWRPQNGRVGRFICDVCYQDGTLFELSPRTILKRITEGAAKEGYTFYIDPECEFFLFHTDDNGVPTTITHEKAGYLDVGPLDLGENARRDMVLTLEEMGFEIESSHHEKGPGQHEIDFTQGEALETADSLMTFKFAIRSIAKRFGLYATFMPKPMKDVMGSGMHLNISVFKDGKNLFETEDGSVSECAKYFMGGVMKHAFSMCAITNPLVNSYKRLVSGYDAPAFIDWSTKGERTLIKHHNYLGDTKVELRFPDPSANPYLAIAICIAAGLDGLKNKIDCGEENTLNPPMLPGALREAIGAFTQDELMETVFSKEFVEIYSDVKMKEWSEYMIQVSDWEVNRYLNKL